MTSGESEVRSKILAVALHLFSAKGYEGVGVQELVESAGITKPTLYYYFGSKAGLLRALLDERYADFDARIGNAAVYRPDPAHYERDVYPALLGVCSAYFLYARANQEFYRLQLALTLAPPDSEGARAARGHNEDHHAILEGMMHAIAERHGNVRKHERLAASLFVGAVNSRVVFFYNGRGTLDEAAARATVRFFMHGLFA